MSHKLDRKRHKRNVHNRLRQLKRRYLKLTQNDTIAPEKALSVLKDSDQVDKAKGLAARRVYVRFASDR